MPASKQPAGVASKQPVGVATARKDIWQTKTIQLHRLEILIRFNFKTFFS